MILPLQQEFPGGTYHTRPRAVLTLLRMSFPFRPMSSGSECLICQDRANAHSHYGAISCTSCRLDILMSMADLINIHNMLQYNVTEVPFHACLTG